MRQKQERSVHWNGSDKTFPSTMFVPNQTTGALAYVLHASTLKSLSLCLDEVKSSDSIDCLISHIKAVDDEQISCIMSGKDRGDKSW